MPNSTEYAKCTLNQLPLLLAFYFNLKALFVLKIFKFFFFLSDHAERKNGMIWKRKLISKFITPQFGNLVHWQLHYTCFLQSKGNQTMELDQLIEYNKRNISLQKSWRKWGRETSSRPLFVFKKAFYEVRASGLQVSFIIFW